MSLSELDTKKSLKVIWVSEGVSKEVESLRFSFLGKALLILCFLFTRKSSISLSPRTAL